MAPTEEDIQKLTHTIERLERHCKRQFWLLFALVLLLASAWLIWDRFGAKFGRTIRADRAAIAELVLDPDPADQLHDLAVSQIRQADRLVEKDDIGFTWNGATISIETDIIERRKFPLRGRVNFNIHVKTFEGQRSHPVEIDYRYTKKDRTWIVLDWRVSYTWETDKNKKEAIYDAMQAAFTKAPPQ